jgi:hypothetical protein
MVKIRVHGIGYFWVGSKKGGGSEFYIIVCVCLTLVSKTLTKGGLGLVIGFGLWLKMVLSFVLDHLYHWTWTLRFFSF